MDLELIPTISQAHPETMDFLSHSWCNFALQAFQPDIQHSSLVVHDNYMINTTIENSIKPTYIKTEDTSKTIPPWKSNDVKSWIWMQQAMHPELNYNSCFRKKWLPTWKLGSIKKWVKDIKQKRKENERLERAQVHAAISVAGVAAALAAIADENRSSSNSTTKDSAVASAAALVAAECMKVAEAMGAKKEKLSGVMSSAMTGTTTTDILTLTAAATTSLRGAATLKARSGVCKKKLNGGAPVLPIEGSHDFDSDFEFEKSRSILAKGAKLPLETSDGRFLTRLVSIISNDEGKVILILRKCNVLGSFTKQKKCIVLDVHAELYKDDSEASGSCYLIVLTTERGMIKLDLMDNYQLYSTWSMAINHLLILSSTTSSYDLQYYK